jgi:hypothetical protein
MMAICRRSEPRDERRGDRIEDESPMFITKKHVSAAAK